VKRRDIETPGFLQRPPGWWRQRRPHIDPAGFTILSFAGLVLAELGELRADEVQRLQRIARGQDALSPIRPDSARRILAAR
jgi:hypothetical protein